MEENIKELGMFEIKNEIIISDPCYDIDNGFNINKKAKKGNWKAVIEISDEEDWGQRVKNLFVSHIDFDYLDSENCEWEEIGYCGVDSGQLGIFDKEIYKNNKSKLWDNMKGVDFCDDDAFYNRMCYLTLGDDNGKSIFGGVFERGVNVSSGFGDGEYLVRGIIKDDLIVGIWVNFIEDEEF